MLLLLLLVRGWGGACGQNVNHVSNAVRCAPHICVCGGLGVNENAESVGEQRGENKQTKKMCKNHTTGIVRSTLCFPPGMYTHTHTARMTSIKTLFWRNRFREIAQTSTFFTVTTFVCRPLAVIYTDLWETVRSQWGRGVLRAP